MAGDELGLWVADVLTCLRYSSTVVAAMHCRPEAPPALASAGLSTLLASSPPSDPPAPTAGQGANTVRRERRQRPR